MMNRRSFIFAWLAFILKRLNSISKMEEFEDLPAGGYLYRQSNLTDMSDCEWVIVPHEGALITDRYVQFKLILQAKK